MASLKCFFRGRHDPRRAMLGAFRCSICGLVGADLDDFPGFHGQGYVPLLRKLFSRKHGGTIERKHWD